jgi:HSP20 family molecular chaperone IbpA
VSSFSRAFNLPADVDAAGMTSEYKDNTLTITIPKTASGTTKNNVNNKSK